MNNKVRLNRLNHFITVLKAVPKKKFKMAYWYNPSYFSEEICVKVPDNFLNVKCTSVACALGWASMDKKFSKAGLGYYAHGSTGEITYKGKIDITAGSLFFGIDAEESNDLFVDGYEVHQDSVTPAMVIRKIKKLIKHYTK